MSFEEWEGLHVEYVTRQDPENEQYMSTDEFSTKAEPIGYYHVGDGVF